MARENLSVRIPNDVLHRVEEFRDDYQLNRTEAIVRACDRGLKVYGYENGGASAIETRLARIARQLASAAVGAAAVLLVIGFFRAWLLAKFVPPLLGVAAGLMMVVYYEPAISTRLARHGRRLAAVVGVVE